MRRFWDELRRRHVVRVAIYYAVFAWVVIQVGDVMLDAFGLSQWLRFLVAGTLLAFPVVLAFSWVFDITPSGVERTAPLPEPSTGPVEAPAGSLAVLPFANLSDDAENEYFSDGLSEEIRNRLASVPGLKVAARSSSFAFKGRHEDAREIGRRLNVAAILEGGVRKHAGAVRISLQLVSTTDGYQVWSEHYERQLEDVFRLQSEIAVAVTQLVTPLSRANPAALPGAAPRSFDAFNLYLRGRHYFHKRTEPALRRAVQHFEQAIDLDPGYALAYTGLSDAWTLLCSRYYGNLPAAESVSKALPAALRALELAPELAEAHASLGLVEENRSDLEAAGRSLRRALQLNPGYTMALVWHGLVLVRQNRFREAAQCNLDALQLDPLSPIINVNVGFDALRWGDIERAKASFAAAIEIAPDFAVPRYGLAHTLALGGEFDAALREVDSAISCAPGRAFYHAQKALIFLQLGDIEAATNCIDKACELSPDNPFDADLVVAHCMALGDHAALSRIARGESRRKHSDRQRGQALVALGEYDAARRLYETAVQTPEEGLLSLATDDWVWRLPHELNRAHLLLLGGDSRGREELEHLLSHLEGITREGVANPLVRYWSASACALLGRDDEARRLLAEARAVGWNHAWWERLDWNLRSLVQLNQ
ncbi:MAG TPA: tetratricopeptide repeat protein [Xanthomonadales bacterium]|nr:tetratricopeptide repeat protein [Xanthomonadales bacterium]